MANPAWPATLQPQLDADGLDEQLPDLTVRTAMAIGPDKVRRRFTAGVTLVSGTILCDADQQTALVDFYYETLGGGTLAFDWTHPRTGGAASFRFRKPPRFRFHGSRALATAQLELEILP